MMECPQCKAIREPRDFLGKTLCYKCVYREKIKSMPRAKENRICPICNSMVPNNRLIYCSEKCKDEADRKRSIERYYEKKERLLMQGSDE